MFEPLKFYCTCFCFCQIIGLAFLVGGCLVKWGSSTINDLLKGALSHVKDAVPKSIGSDLENFDLAEFIGKHCITLSAR